MLGDYAITSEIDVLAERNRAGGQRHELTRLRGARMMPIYETSRRMALSASLVKTLAGGGLVTWLNTKQHKGTSLGRLRMLFRLLTLSTLAA
jgi:phage/plasmid-associated DNA primase